MKQLDGRLMWQRAVVSGSVWIERQLWLAWHCSCKLGEDMHMYVTMQAGPVGALLASYLIAHLQFKSSCH